MKNKIILFIVMICICTDAYAQSIGASSEKTIQVEVNVPTISYFSVSQGADYAESITIEEEYPWLDIEEKSFILESKSKKTIKASIDIEKPGIYDADIRICGSPISAEGVLSAKACTSYKMTVIAESEKKVPVFAIGAVLLATLIIYLYIHFLKKKN